MKRATFYKCERCGNIAIKVVDGGGKMMCCGQEMTVVETNAIGAAEKHTPEAEYINGDLLKVTVGEVDHPMDEDHYIEWIYLVTQHGVQAICLTPGIAPTATFSLFGDKPLKAFAYCNKHGLWEADLSDLEFDL